MGGSTTNKILLSTYGKVLIQRYLSDSILFMVLGILKNLPEQCLPQW